MTFCKRLIFYLPDFYFSWKNFSTVVALKHQLGNRFPHFLNLAINNQDVVNSARWQVL